MDYRPQMTTWLNPDIDYLFNEEITEYDMKDAGFSLIKEFKLLPTQKIQELEAMGKGIKRHKAIGILQRDDRLLSDQLLNKFADARDVFIQANSLTSDDIISVKKDAFFTTKKCSRLKFGHVEFAEKNKYSSYIRFPGSHVVEIYYSNAGMDIKGIGDIGLNRHRLTMLEFLQTVIPKIESKDESVKRFMTYFIQHYKENELEEEYYLEFNNMSMEMNPAYNFQNIIIPLVQIILREMR